LSTVRLWRITTPYSLIYRVCRDSNQCQAARPVRRTGRVKTRPPTSLQKSHTQLFQSRIMVVVVADEHRDLGCHGHAALTLLSARRQTRLLARQTRRSPGTGFPSQGYEEGVTSNRSRVHGYPAGQEAARSTCAGGGGYIPRPG